MKARDANNLSSPAGPAGSAGSRFGRKPKLAEDDHLIGVKFANVHFFP